MWEFSLYFEKNLLPYFNDLKKDLKNLFKNFSNCVAIGIKDNEYVFMIALPIKVFNLNENQIKQKIAEIICLYYKPYYILKSLNSFDLKNFDNKILLDILSSYESKQDIQEITEILSINNIMYLNSYISFKLKNQLKKWQEIGLLINENSLFLFDKAIRQELIKFLMKGLQSQTEILTLTKDSNQICINDADSKKLDIKTVFYAQNEYDNLLYNIINKFPKNIKIKNSKSFDVKFLDCLYNLFGDNVILA